MDMNMLMMAMLLGGRGGLAGGGGGGLLGLMMAPDIAFPLMLMGKRVTTKDILLSRMMPDLKSLIMIKAVTTPPRRRFRRRTYRRRFRRY